MKLLLDLLAGGAVLAFGAAALGLAAVTTCRLMAWWRAGQHPKGVRVVISIG